MQPLFWVASRPAAREGEEDDDHVPLRFGFTIARPGADGAGAAVAHALRSLVEACVELEGCVSAVVAAQELPLSLASPPLVRSPRM